MEGLIQQGVRVDAIVSDIPYFQIVRDDWDNQWKNEEEYLSWVNDCLTRGNSLLKDNGSVILFTGRQYNRKICGLLDNLFDEKRIIVWARKRTFNNTRGKALASGYEPICYYTKGSPTFNNIKIMADSNRPEYTTGCLKDGVSLSDVWADIPALPHNSKEKVGHPTQKPVKLMERCVLLTTREHDTILDFTMGSGSTGVACKNLNRGFIGIELNKEYFNIAKRRIEGTLDRLF